LSNKKSGSRPRLIRQADGVILWAENYDSNLSERSPFDVQLELGAAIAMAVAQRLGVAVEPTTRSETPEEIRPVMDIELERLSQIEKWTMARR